MPQPYHTFETERLLLRATTEADAPFMLELLNSPKWLQFIGDRQVHTEEDAKQYIRSRILPQFERLGYANYTVTRKADGVPLGTCGLYSRAGLSGIDIGYAFLPQHEGQGYAYEAAATLKEAAFHTLLLPAIGAITTKSNHSSQKLLQKLGLRFMKYITLPDEDEELMYFELQKPESHT
ncbi:GNAT family N-acetyltransferase [Pontibacter oryzae]|uniref:N-acetyltransferase n=1 Tax=Pontibacter oryzae TaxID=2304593 RepID=A0A399S4R9_9BACT|nr:GNAT family N-acetyltransferase [Pontibacter oryzae]RIJ37403.1 N-acetyltransferase [Pontibacter oryzae]